MKTATKVVRATGPKSILESIEARATTDLKAAEARIGTAMAELDAKVEREASLITATVVEHGRKLEAMAEHEVRLAALEAREIDRQATSMLKRVGRWLVRWDGWV